MKPLKAKIVRMLTDTAKTPSMYAITVEVMLMRISTLLEVGGVDFSVVEFYCKHGGKHGNTYLFELPEGMTFDAWAKVVVADALSMVEATASLGDTDEAAKTV